MPRNGSGTYIPPNGAENAFSGQTISSATWNNIFTDLSNALTGSLALDGQSTMTGRLLVGQFAPGFNQALFTSQDLHGVVSPTDNFANIINVGADDADMTDAGFLRGLFIQHAFGGAACHGTRSALNVALVFTAPTVGTPPAGNGHTCLFTQVEIGSGDGGGLGTEKGGFFSGNITIDALPAATHLQAVIGTEFNVAVQAGASTLVKQCIRIASLPQDQVQGTQSDVAIVMLGAPGTPGWQYGLQFERQLGNGQPISTTGTLIGATAGAAWTVANGVDLSPVTFSSSAFKSPGFTVDGSGNITFAGQLAFPAVQNPSSNVNTLDDYEEGTFVPALTFGGGSTGITYSTQTGKYTKIGNVVIVWIHLVLTNKGSSTGLAGVGNLPFNATTDVEVTSHGNNLAAGVTTSLSSTISSGTGQINVGKYAAGATSQLSDTDFNNNTVLLFTGVYPS